MRIVLIFNVHSGVIKMIMLMFIHFYPYFVGAKINKQKIMTVHIVINSQV